MVQNHALQLLDDARHGAPVHERRDAIRDEKLKVLQVAAALHPGDSGAMSCGASTARA
jgi:glucose-6-phosphate 1-dehydrogenase